MHVASYKLPKILQLSVTIPRQKSPYPLSEITVGPKHLRVIIFPRSLAHLEGIISIDAVVPETYKGCGYLAQLRRNDVLIGQTNEVAFSYRIAEGSDPEWYCANIQVPNTFRTEFLEALAKHHPNRYMDLLLYAECSNA